MTMSVSMSMSTATVTTNHINGNGVHKHRSGSNSSFSSNSGSIRKSIIDLSKDHSGNQLQQDRQAMTADLAELKKRIHALQREKRPKHLPYNAHFWKVIQDILQPASDVGFQQPSDKDGTYQVRSIQDVMEMGQKVQQVYDKLMPLDCYQIAKDAEVPLETALVESLYAAKAGIADMAWTTQCGGCGGSTERLDSLGEFTETATCQNCPMKHNVQHLEQMKVSFKFNECILYFPTRGSSCPHSPEADRIKYFQFKLWVPPTTNDTKWSYMFGMKQEHPKSQDEPLAPGRYRFHCPFAMVDCFLDVKRVATSDDEPIRILLKNSEMTCPYLNGRTERTVFEVEHGRMSLDFLADMNSVMALWVYKDIPDDKMIMFAMPQHAFKPYASAADLVHMQAFKDMFGNQIISSASHFSIQMAFLVFTDVVSSTDLYESAGDGKALKVVQDHFEIVFGAFEANGGRIVKTIGDAVMGAFVTGEKAVRAVAQAMEGMMDLKRPDGTPFQIRIGMHAGAALVVPLNGINDYFGKTVNVAARVESKAVGGECLVSEAVFNDTSAHEALEELFLDGALENTRAEQLSLKGVPEPIAVRGFKKPDQDHSGHAFVGI